MSLASPIIAVLAHFHPLLTPPIWRKSVLPRQSSPPSGSVRPEDVTLT